MQPTDNKAPREDPEWTGALKGAFPARQAERWVIPPGELGEVSTHSLLSVAKTEFVLERTMSMQTTTSYAFHRLGNPGQQPGN